MRSLSFGELSRMEMTMSGTRQSLINHSAATAANGLAALLARGTVLGSDPFRTLTGLRGTGSHSRAWLALEQQANTAWGVLVALVSDQRAAYRLTANALEELASDYGPKLRRQCLDLAEAIRAGVGDVG